jgi:hypothetical protein
MPLIDPFTEASDLLENHDIVVLTAKAAAITKDRIKSDKAAFFNFALSSSSGSEVVRY